jgi:transglutaminase-like putative cysteine protease
MQFTRIAGVLIAPTVLLLSAAAQEATTGGAEPQADPARKSRAFEFTYRASIEAAPEGARQVRLWIPVPVETPDQQIWDLEIEASHPYEVHPIEGGLGKSLCITSDGGPVSVRETFKVRRYETHGGGKASERELEKALAADRFIPLDGKVAAIAASLKLSEERLDAARALYLHTLERMRYDKPAGEPWGRGDSEWACDSRFGNCTDFHSYFMGLARTRGIPARFEMGFPIPAGEEPQAKVGGYHCWAYFWSDERGWVPVDISEADKEPAKAEYFFGTLDEHRVTMTRGRDLLLTPRPAQGALNFFVYPHAEVDGKEFKDVQREFSRRNL